MMRRHPNFLLGAILTGTLILTAVISLIWTPYAFDAAQAAELASVGADIIVAHMGLTTSGTIGAKTAMDIDAAVGRVAEIADAARSVRDDVLVLCHGGPIAMPEDAAYVPVSYTHLTLPTSDLV